MFDSCKVSLVKLTLFIVKTNIMTIDNSVLDAKAKAVVNKNVFNTLFSLVLYANIIEKNMIERNIKNSTIIRSIIRERTNITEKLPSIRKDNNSLRVSNMVGEINIISNDTTTVKKANDTSIKDVKYLEVMIWAFVTGSV